MRALSSLSCVFFALLAPTLTWAAKTSDAPKPDAPNPNQPETRANIVPEDKPTDKATKKGDQAPAVDFKSGDVWNVDIFKQEDHKVLVIQDRRYTKAKKFELGVQAGLTSASPFYNTQSFGVDAAYYFSEYLGIDGFYNYSTSQLSADAKQINDFLAAHDFTSVKEYQKPVNFAGLGLIWAPIYGKFAFFRSSIIHFDFYGTLGASVVTLKTNHPLGKDQTNWGSLLSIGVRVFLSKHWSLRFDTRENLYRSYFAPAGTVDNPGEGKNLWRQNFQFTLGASYLFGGN